MVSCMACTTGWPTTCRSLLRSVMLRRTKASVEVELALPPCTRVDQKVALSVVERAFYAELLRRFK